MVVVMSRREVGKVVMVTTNDCGSRHDVNYRERWWAIRVWDDQYPLSYDRSDLIRSTNMMPRDR